MARPRSGSTPLFEPVVYINWTPRNEFQYFLNQNWVDDIYSTNAFETFLRPQYIMPLHLFHWRLGVEIGTSYSDW